MNRPVTEQKARRILVVDDQAVLLMHVSAVLESDGFTVMTAVDEAHAVELSAAAPPDVVLVDIRLDREDGAELITRLRQSTPDAVYVAMSAYTDAESIIRAMQSGAHDYLTKPFSDEDLRLLLDRSYQRLSLSREKASIEESLRVSNNELRRMNERLRLMVETVENIRSGSTPDEETQSLLVEFARMMGANGGSLYVRDGDELVLMHSITPSGAVDRIALPPDPASVLARALATRRPVFVEDVTQDESLTASGWSGYDSGSLLSFPLYTPTGPVEGVVNLHDPTDPPFTAQDLDLGVIFASLVLEAIHTAQAAELLDTVSCVDRELDRPDRVARPLRSRPVREPFGATGSGVSPGGGNRPACVLVHSRQGPKAGPRDSELGCRRGERGRGSAGPAS